MTDEAETPATKRTKLASSPPPPPQGEDDDGSVVVINRAPVLQLWASCVARFLHPELSPDECFGAGAVVAALCAVAKGRAIGVVQGEEGKKKKGGANDDGGEVLDVMGFALRLKDGFVLAGKEKKKGGEAALKRKFGDKEFERVKGVFEAGLKAWEGEGEELNKRAFHFYERFRPDVAQGQQGWGRKGELKLEKVRETVARAG